MNSIRKVITLVLCFLFPTILIYWILNLLGHQIHSKSRIGFSVLWINGKLILNEFSAIGSFNIIKVNDLSIDKSGYIGKFNRLDGPIEFVLKEKTAIGNSNKFYRAPEGISYGKAFLKIGAFSKITANHRIDCIRSVSIGDYSILAGHESQLWTHAYYHDKKGPGRFRLDGDIEIGNNVYIGSRCVINCGVKIADTVVVGANSCVSKSLLEPGTYVNQPLRHIETNENENARNKFNKVEGFKICEEVYQRKGN